MKVIAINGSPNKNGNTAKVLEIMAQVLSSHNIETETAHIGGKLIHGCIGCGKCFKSETSSCVFGDDPVNEVTAKMREADGFILGSPTYFGGIAGTMKCFLDRAFYSSYKGMLRHKAATAVAVARRSGGVEVTSQLKHYLTLAETLIAPSQYWQVVYGAIPGDVTQDAEGIAVITANAKALAWLINMSTQTKDSIVPPHFEKRPRTNFIR